MPCFSEQQYWPDLLLEPLFVGGEGTIPDGVKSIRYAAFQNCTSLENITIPNNVTSIGNCAFLGCTSLSSVTIPNNVISIGTSAFNNCTNLKTLKYKGTEAQWETISKGSNWNNNCPAEVVFNYEGNE